MPSKTTMCMTAEESVINDNSDDGDKTSNDKESIKFFVITAIIITTSVEKWKIVAIFQNLIRQFSQMRNYA